MSNHSKKIIRNIALIVFLLFLFLMRSGLYLTPLSAHEHSERSIHYGPSKVVHVEDFDKGKYILGTYDNWVSCNTVNRRLFFFWGFGDQPIGIENDKTKPLDFTWQASRENSVLYGIINDHRIKKVEITLNTGETLTQTKFYNDLFLFTRTHLNSDGIVTFKDVKGYDSDARVIFQSKIP